MPEIKLVKQKHDHACSIACAAMVTGENYDELIKEFGNNFHKRGIDEDIFFDFLGNKGFSMIQKEATRWSKKDFARTEMLRPFAPIHILKIKITADAGLLHWVVMTKKGSLLCPLGYSDEETRKSYLIDKIVGLYAE